jgi:hypothetical protein
MIDGVKIHYDLPNFQEWKEEVNIPFGVTVLDSGEVKSKIRHVNGLQQRTLTHRGTFQTYHLQVKEIERKQFKGEELKDHFLTIDGSLHKNYFGGENHARFEWDKLQTEILNIANGLQISPEVADIVNIEFGVNIPLPFPVFPFLKKCLISHKGKPFSQYRPDRNGFVLGYVCDHSQYSVKIYDKGKQFNLPGPLLRFELRFIKMQPLKDYGIKTLFDLMQRDKVSNMASLLFNAWENVLLWDQSINLNRTDLRPKERELLLRGSNPKFWEQLKETNRRAFNSKREQFRELLQKYGQNLNGLIRSQIKNEWENLFENCTILPTAQTPELYKFPVKVKGKNVQLSPIAGTIKKECISCGKDISCQRGSSKFCSPKYVGDREAHKCRNKDSNQRNNRKAKIERIKSRGLLFDITPHLIDKNNKIQNYAI